MNGVSEDELRPESFVRVSKKGPQRLGDEMWYPTGFLRLVARICFLDTPSCAFSCSCVTDSGLGLFYSVLCLLPNVGHDRLDGVLDAADYSVLPAAYALGAEHPDGQETKGQIKGRESEVDTSHDPAIFLAELFEALKEGLWRRASEV